MKAIFYKFMLTVIVCFGLIVGVVKGQEARQKWVTKKKMKYEQKRIHQAGPSEVALDEIELATYHQ